MSKMGRPTKYRKKYCEDLILHMAQGYSFDSFAGVIGINRDSIYQWVAKHKDFADARSIGYAEGLLYMEKVGKAAMLGKIPGFRDKMHNMKMKNIYGWKDRVDVTSNDEAVQPAVVYIPDDGSRINEE